MNRFFTLLLAASCLTAVGQVPQFPYNPDENNDGFIGVNDLTGLLANFDEEFSAAVLSENGEVAVTYVGDMPYPPCVQSCRNLSGIWHVISYDDLGIIWDDILDPNLTTWVDEYDRSGLAVAEVAATFFTTYNFGSNLPGIKISQDGLGDRRCYCVARQLPRIDYEVVVAPSEQSFRSACQALTAEGWLPVAGSPSLGGGSSSYSQSFWRFAQ